MATTTWNYDVVDSDTALGTDTSIPLISFDNDFVKKETKANEAVLTNLTSPLGRVESIRFAYQRVGNIYSNTGIDPSVYAASRQGFSILAQVNDILTYIDDAQTRSDLPLSAHLVIKAAQHEAITGDVLLTLVKRLVATIVYGDSATPTDGRVVPITSKRLEALARGAVVPKALV